MATSSIKGASGTTVLTQVGGKNVAQARQPAKSRLPIVFTTDSVQDRVTLQHQLGELNDLAATAYEVASENLLVHSVLIQNISATAGTVLAIKHTLGRAPVGWLAVRAAPNPFEASEVSLPTGIPASEQLFLLPGITTTVTLLLF